MQFTKALARQHQREAAGQVEGAGGGGIRADRRRHATQHGHGRDPSGERGRPGAGQGVGPPPESPMTPSPSASRVSATWATSAAQSATASYDARTGVQTAIPSTPTTPRRTRQATWPS